MISYECKKKDLKWEDQELVTLLDLNGEIYHIEKGYWVKFKADAALVTPEIPHGIRYSLTLHDRANNRILGFDNAHAIRSSRRNRKKYTARKITWDHVHKEEKVTPYDFNSASQLIEDFWCEVDNIVC